MASNSFAGQPQYLTASLPALPQHLQSDTQLTAHLASRFHAHIPSALLSSQGVVALNSYTRPDAGVEGSEEGSGAAATKDLGARAYARLGRRNESQAIVFL